jgi:hypothetical protein
MMERILRRRKVLLSYLVVLLTIFNANAQVFSSSNLPIIVINTGGQAISDEPKIIADMGIIFNGPGQRNNLTDPYNNYNGKIGIEIRGSSSQSFPKKQYGVELRDALGNGIAASLLGMPAEEDWVLFAPYNDKSLMRDVLAYKLGRDLGRYAPRTKFCEVVLNGQYMGVYVLIEKVKRDKNRVDIARLDPQEISGDDLTGGYIIKIDKETGSGNGGWFSDFLPPNRSSSQRIYYQYDYPKADNISAPQRQYIQQFMFTFESVLNSSTYNDPFNGYSKYIDVDSFIDYFIINEVSKNVDGYRLSTYLHKDKNSNGGKLHMGPIWDYNLGFGNADYCTKGDPEGWVTNFNNLCSQDFWLIPFWWDRLYQDAAYRNKLGLRWAELRENELQTSRILTYIDSVASVLNVEAQQRNFQRWPVLNRYVWPNYFVGPTFDSEISWLKGWVTQRLQWMDIQMPKPVTSVKDQFSNDGIIQVYPNPASSEMHVWYSIKSPGVVAIEITDMFGRRLMNQQENRELAGEYQATLDVSQLPNGFYFYHVEISGQVSATGKFVKTN